MRKWLFILLNLISPSIYAQLTLDSIPLTWDNFSILDGRSGTFRYSAYINTTTLYECEIKKNGQRNSMVVRSEVKIRKNRSWVYKGYLDNTTAEEKQELLDHEKGHLILALIHQKILCEKIRENRLGRNPKSEIGKLYRNMRKDLSKDNKLYDKETNHMFNREKQKQWIDKLLIELNRLYNTESLSLKCEVEIILNQH